jgi:hypothetical protein
VILEDPRLVMRQGVEQVCFGSLIRIGRTLVRVKHTPDDLKAETYFNGKYGASRSFRPGDYI